MSNELFRQKSLERISSPEELHDYMRVTSPRLWMILTAIVVLLAGFIVFAATTRMESTEKIQVRVTGNSYITGRIPAGREDLVSVGMPVRIGDISGKITQIEKSTELRLKTTFASTEPVSGDFFLLSIGDDQDVSFYNENGETNQNLIYTYLMENEFYIMMDDRQKIGEGDTLARFWNVGYSDGKMELYGGRLATLSGTDTVVVMMITVMLDDPAAELESGQYDAEIVTESTSPISFLWN